MACYLRKLQVIFVLFGFTALVEAKSYNVIAEPPVNMNVVVVVDNVAFPLKPEHGILYKGEAPSAKTSYNYAFVNGADIKISESFLRPPLPLESSTLNEFFNRSSNSYNIKTLPQVLPHLESIHRIKSDLHIQNQIPTIHIYGKQSNIDALHNNQLEELDFKMNFAYIGLKDIKTFENVKISLAGANTREMEKLSYTLKLDKKSDATLFGFKNIKLRSLGRDPSYLRESLCHNVFKSCGIPVSEFSYVRLFINNQAIGFFGLIETFQDPWLAAVFADGSTNYKSGHLYQGVGANNIKSVVPSEPAASDLHYEPNLEKYAAGQYKVKAGPNKKHIEAFEELQEFTKFINDSTPQSEWEKILDVDGLIRVLVVDDLMGLSDSYVSLSNNYYLYKDPNQNGRITFIPADFDTTLGRTFYNIPAYVSGNYAEHPNLLFRPLTKAILSNPNYLNSFKKMHLALAKNLINSEFLNPYIDSIIEMIRTDTEWDSGLKRVGKNAKRITPSDSTIVKSKFLKEHTAPGLTIHFGETKSISMDASINGGLVGNYTLGLKEFISRKNLAVLQFYK